ncbi:trichohyalin-like [Rhinatrema bivittatum]|uniref:trichohyalin-like n=1 Tax=Rhinatrema bivittatum TaxID=194408 RepID=UPI00112B6E4A|nr:trichohyalin-like [Rhinatrema bivittatum]XP_029436751.1 trichohyalin-like [Rhinatrema bivittatum]XP_029436752.1 trichohyalin-like [Rhinatrema bivittatum]
MAQRPTAACTGSPGRMGASREHLLAGPGFTGRPALAQEDDGHQPGPQEKDREVILRLKEELRATRARAEEEKERALRDQEKSFARMMEEAGRSRDHLEEERLLLLRRKLEQEREEALRVELAPQHAVEAAAAALRSQLLGEVRQEMLRDAKVAQVVIKGDSAEQLEAAVLEGRRQAEEERAETERRRAQEARSLKDMIQELQAEVFRLTREKMEYEREFQELQLNYKRFIDLMDSSLHSDYLLRLRHLGRPPGRADTSAQTEGLQEAREGERFALVTSLRAFSAGPAS